MCTFGDNAIPVKDRFVTAVLCRLLGGKHRRDEVERLDVAVLIPGIWHGNQAVDLIGGNRRFGTQLDP